MDGDDGDDLFLLTLSSYRPLSGGQYEGGTKSLFCVFRAQALSKPLSTFLPWPQYDEKVITIVLQELTALNSFGSTQVLAASCALLNNTSPANGDLPSRERDLE